MRKELLLALLASSAGSGVALADIVVPTPQTGWALSGIQKPDSFWPEDWTSQTVEVTNPAAGKLSGSVQLKAGMYCMKYYGDNTLVTLANVSDAKTTDLGSNQHSLTFEVDKESTVEITVVAADGVGYFRFGMVTIALNIDQAEINQALTEALADVPEPTVLDALTEAAKDALEDDYNELTGNFNGFAQKKTDIGNDIALITKDLTYEEYADLGLINYPESDKVTKAIEAYRKDVEAYNEKAEAYNNSNEWIEANTRTAEDALKGQFGRAENMLNSYNDILNSENASLCDEDFKSGVEECIRLKEQFNTGLAGIDKDQSTDAYNAELDKLDETKQAFIKKIQDLYQKYLDYQSQIGLNKANEDAWAAIWDKDSGFINGLTDTYNKVSGYFMGLSGQYQIDNMDKAEKLYNEAKAAVDEQIHEDKSNIENANDNSKDALNAVNEGIDALEALYTEVKAVVDEVNAAVADANTAIEVLETQLTELDTTDCANQEALNDDKTVIQGEIGVLKTEVANTAAKYEVPVYEEEVARIQVLINAFSEKVTTAKAVKVAYDANVETIKGLREELDNAKQAIIAAEADGYEISGRFDGAYNGVAGAIARLETNNKESCAKNEVYDITEADIEQVKAGITSYQTEGTNLAKLFKDLYDAYQTGTTAISEYEQFVADWSEERVGGNTAVEEPSVAALETKVEGLKKAINDAYANENAQDMLTAANAIDPMAYSVADDIEQGEKDFMYAVTDGNRVVALAKYSTLHDQLDGIDEKVKFTPDVIGQDHWTDVSANMREIWAQINTSNPTGTLTQAINDAKVLDFLEQPEKYKGYIDEINNLISEIDGYSELCKIYQTNETNNKALADAIANTRQSLDDLITWLDENTTEGATTTYKEQVESWREQLTTEKEKIDAEYAMTEEDSMGITAGLLNGHQEVIDGIADDIAALPGLAEKNETTRKELLSEATKTLSAINSALAEVKTLNSDVYSVDEINNALNEQKTALAGLNKEVYDSFSDTTLNEVGEDGLTNGQKFKSEYEKIRETVADQLTKVHSDYQNAVNDANKTALYNYWNLVYDELLAAYRAAVDDYSEYAKCTGEANYHYALVEVIGTYLEQINAYTDNEPAEGAEPGKIYALDQQVRAMVVAAVPTEDVEEWDADNIDVLTADDFLDFQSTAMAYINELVALDDAMKLAANDYALTYFNDIYTDARAKVNAAKALMKAAMTDEEIAEPIIANAIEPYNNRLNTANGIKKEATALSLKMDEILEALKGITAENIKIRTEAAANTYWVKVYGNAKKAMEDVVKSIGDIEGIDVDAYVDEVDKLINGAGVLNGEESDAYARLSCLESLSDLCTRLDALVQGANAQLSAAEVAQKAAQDNIVYLTQVTAEIGDLTAEWNALCGWVGALALDPDNIYHLNLSNIKGSIDALYKEVSYNKEKALDNKANYDRKISSIRTGIANAYAQAFNYEKAMLTDRLATIVEKFNTLKTQESDDNATTLEKWNDTIDDLVEKIHALTAPATAEEYTEDLKNELIDYEKQVDEIGKAIYGAAGDEWSDSASPVEAVREGLQAQHDQVMSVANALQDKLENCGFDSVKTEYQKSLSELVAPLNGLPLKWKSDGNAIVATAPGYAQQMSAIEAALNGQKTLIDKAIEEAQALKDKQDASQVAFNKLSGELDNLQNELDAANETIEGYELTGADFSSQLLVHAQEMIDAARTKLEADNAEANLTGDSTIEDAATISLAVSSALKDATTAETTAQIAAAREAVNAAADFIVGSNFTNEKELKATLANLQARLSNIKATDDAQAAPDVIAAAQALKAEAEQLLADAEEGKMLIGDLNGDGELSVSDVTTLIALITSGEADDNMIADVNGDGYSNVADISSLIRLVLGGDTVKTRILSKAPAVQGDNSMRVVCLSEEAGVRHLAVLLDNSATFVNGQMDITLGDGMRIVNETLGERASALELYSATLANGKHRIVVASTEFNDIIGNDGAVIYLDVAGNGDLSIDNVVFGDRRGKAYNIGGNGAGMSGIQDITSPSQSLGRKIYNVGGMMLDRLQRGINIIRKADGTTEKVIKK